MCFALVWASARLTKKQSLTLLSFKYENRNRQTNLKWPNQAKLCMHRWMLLRNGDYIIMEIQDNHRVVLKQRRCKDIQWRPIEFMEKHITCQPTKQIKCTWKKKVRDSQTRAIPLNFLGWAKILRVCLALCWLFQNAYVLLFPNKVTNWQPPF